MSQKKLVRSSNKVLAGICGGFAEYLDVDPTVVRVIYLALTIFSAAFPGVLLYLILLFVIPQGNKNDRFEDAEVVK